MLRVSETVLFRRKKTEAASKGGQNRNLSDQDKDVIETIRNHFDPPFYLSQNPDVEHAGIDPLVHYTLYGWRDGRDPSPDFSTRFYLSNNPDVAEANVNPFWHYIVVGKAEGRVLTAPEPAPESGVVVNDQPLTEKQFAQEVATIRSAFDSEFYLRHNPDVVQAGIDPVEHFVVSGWKEGRDPNRWFSVSYYLEANPDIREMKINPLWNYIVAGKSEGRLARHPGGYRAETLLHSRPLEETVRAWSSRKPPETLMSAAQISALVRNAAGDKAALMISIGQDNYREVPGGVQFCIQHEEEIACDRGVLYLNLHPYQPLPRLAHDAETPDVPVSLLLAGETLGTAPMSAVAQAVSMMGDDFDAINVVVHHLLGHSPEQVAALVRATGHSRCWMWLHDFFSLCPNYALQRNNVTFCGAPPMASNACRLCLYGNERLDHSARMARFFEDLSVHVIAPSQFTADYWSERAGLKPAALTVREHATIDWAPRLEEALGADGPITVAFVGYPASHKGWPVFESLVHANGGKDSTCRFLYFGASQIALDEVERIQVQVTAKDPDAMTRALAEHKVDIVLHWASCAETFSFSTYEAVAAGAYVLTNPISGNVAVTVRRLGTGRVLEDEADLEAFFRDGRLEAMVAEARARRQDHGAVLSRSDLTFAVLDQEPRQ